METHNHLPVQTPENKPTATTQNKPRMVLKFRIKSENKKDEAVEQTLIASSNNEESKKVKNSDKKSAASGKKTDKREKKKRRPFSISLTREEIEADIEAIGGSKKRPRRIKKRPQSVQQVLDNLFPGLRLKHITADDYRVPDSP
ncbi:hypothetical protein Pint_16496 [Pistacia integerrima]|uniref:Uncharacterized protein n=1 Tax=Pistacia integerrima TaxID=434235 RepID=A0ACC0ZB32_9ROSI|nr:hypothetical protein Pint_16496 [Pistacia integerrima]